MRVLFYLIIFLEFFISIFLPSPALCHSPNWIFLPLALVFWMLLTSLVTSMATLVTLALFPDGLLGI